METSNDDARDGLDELVESGLVGRTVGVASEPRYTMLETVREFALERLTGRQDADRLRRAHARYFVAYAALPKPFLLSEHDAAWVARVDQDYGNFTTALRWTLERHESEMALRLACALWPYWQDFGLFREGNTWLAPVIAQSDGLAPELRAEALTGAIALNFSSGDHARARTLAEQCWPFWRRLGDHRGMATVRTFQGLIGLNAGDYEQAVGWYQEAAAHWEALGYGNGVARALNEIALVRCLTGQFDEAQRLMKDVRARYESDGDEIGLARTFTEFGLIALFRRDPLSAVPLFDEGIQRSRPIRGNQNLLYTLFYSGLAHMLLGQLDIAAARMGESLRLRHELSEIEGIAYCLFGIAGVASRRARTDRSAQLLGAAFGLLEAIGIKLSPMAQALYDSEVAGLRKQLDDAACAIGLARGRGLTLDEAVQEAMAEVEA